MDSGCNLDFNKIFRNCDRITENGEGRGTDKNEFIIIMSDAHCMRELLPQKIETEFQNRIWSTEMVARVSSILLNGFNRFGFNLENWNFGHQRKRKQKQQNRNGAGECASEMHF